MIEHNEKAGGFMLYTRLFYYLRHSFWPPKGIYQGISDPFFGINKFSCLQFLL